MYATSHFKYAVIVFPNLYFVFINGIQAYTKCCTLCALLQLQNYKTDSDLTPRCFYTYFIVS